MRRSELGEAPNELHGGEVPRGEVHAPIVRRTVSCVQPTSALVSRPGDVAVRTHRTHRGCTQLAATKEAHLDVPLRVSRRGRFATCREYWNSGRYGKLATKLARTTSPAHAIMYVYNKGLVNVIRLCGMGEEINQRERRPAESAGHHRDSQAAAAGYSAHSTFTSSGSNRQRPS